MKKIFSLMMLCAMLSACSSIEKYTNPTSYNKKQEEKSKQEQTERISAEIKKRDAEDLIKFTKNCEEMTKKYADRPARSLDEMLPLYINSVKANGYGIKNQSKNNMVLLAQMFDEIKKGWDEIGDILGNNKKFSNETCYVNLNSKLSRLNTELDSIYSYCYEYEKKDFIKTFGKENKAYPLLAHIIFNLPAKTPEKGVIYDLSGTSVVQNIDGGLLLGAQFNRHLYPLIFVYTGKRFVDETRIDYRNEIYATYDGPKTYTNVLGGTNTVHSFKEVDLSNQQKKLDSYFCYKSSNAYIVNMRQPSEKELQATFTGLK
jgi:hypothetical protein